MTIDEILRDQDGVIARRQATAAGLGAAAIKHRLATGAWLPVRRAVFRSAAHAETDGGRVWADALWLGDRATLLALGAAWWLRLADAAPTRFRFAVPGNRRVRSTPTTGVVRRDLDDTERVLVGGIHVTTRAVTVLDAVAELGPTAGADLMDRALLRDRVTVESLREAHWRSLGRRGSSAAGDALVLAAGGARFAAERRLHRRLREDGIGGWVADLPVVLAGYGEAILDLAFPERRVVVEVDGWAHHRDVDDFRRDRRRQNALVLAGWTVVRVTWHDLVGDPERAVGWIRDALGRDRRECSVLVP